MEFVLNDKYSNKSLNPLGEVGYMDYTNHLAQLKTKTSNILFTEILLNNFGCITTANPFPNRWGQLHELSDVTPYCCVNHVYSIDKLSTSVFF